MIIIEQGPIGKVDGYKMFVWQVEMPSDPLCNEFYTNFIYKT